MQHATILIRGEQFREQLVPIHVKESLLVIGLTAETLATVHAMATTPALILKVSNFVLATLQTCDSH
jgi:flagellar biogenesis protein FliO